MSTVNSNRVEYRVKLKQENSEHKKTAAFFKSMLVNWTKEFQSLWRSFQARKGWLAVATE